MSFMSEPINLFPVKPQRSLTILVNGKYYYFTDYVTISEDATDTIKITQHPVQQGAMISDHAYKEPSKVRLRLIVGSGTNTLAQIYAYLLLWQSTRVPIKVITGKRQYDNMLIATLDQTTDKFTENILSVTLSFEEIILVQVTPTTVPKRSSQANVAKTASTENTGKQSLLFKGAAAGGDAVSAVTNFFSGIH